ncbi:hypothetical protein V2J09_000560 [Rumex salicifolius]
MPNLCLRLYISSLSSSSNSACVREIVPTLYEAVSFLQAERDVFQQLTSIFVAQTQFRFLHRASQSVQNSNSLEHHIVLLKLLDGCLLHLQAEFVIFQIPSHHLHLRIPICFL